MRSRTILPFVISLILLVLMAKASGLEGDFLNKASSTLTLEIDTGDRVTISVEDQFEQSNSTIHCFVILPFAIDEISAFFPNQIFCSFQNYQNQYAVISLYLQPDITRFEVKAVSKTLVAKNGDGRKILLDFRYDSVPTMISYLINETNTISRFQTLRVIFPQEIDVSEIFETPHYNKTTDHAQDFTLESILASGEGKLSLGYSVKGVFWIYEMIFSAVWGVPTVMGILLWPGDKIKLPKGRRHVVFITVVSCVWGVTVFSTVMLVLFGPVWDAARTYYAGLVLNSLAMIHWMRYACQARQPKFPSNSQNFVGSRNSNTYHYPSCKRAQKIEIANRVFFASVDYAAVLSYTPCHICRPPSARVRKKKMTPVVIGVFLIIGALILGAAQGFNLLGYNLYGSSDNKWYFYGLVGVIGLIGIILAAWSFDGRRVSESS